MASIVTCSRVGQALASWIENATDEQRAILEAELKLFDSSIQSATVVTVGLDQVLQLVVADPDGSDQRTVSVTLPPTIQLLDCDGAALPRLARDKLNQAKTANDYGAAVGTSNSLAAFQAARDCANDQKVTFEPDRGRSSNYTINGATSADTDGVMLDVPVGISLTLAGSGTEPLEGMLLERQTHLRLGDIDSDYYPAAAGRKQINKSGFLSRGSLRQQTLLPINASQLTFLSIIATSSDTFQASSPAFADARSYSYGGTPADTWQGAFTSLRRGETLTANCSKVGNGSLGVMFRHSAGYSVLYSDPTAPGSGMLLRTVKNVGSAAVTAQDLSFPGRGVDDRYNPSIAVWGVTITASGSAVVTLNGHAVTAPEWVYSSLGDIYEVAFVWKPSESTATAAWSDLMLERNSDPLARADLAEVRIFGDSTSETLVGSWEHDLKDMLDLTFGVKLATISNFAVAGTNSLDARQSMTLNGLGAAYYVVIATGTNDIQGGAAAGVTEGNVKAMIDQVKAAGRVPVIVSPYLWYNTAQSGGRGIATANYERGGATRARLARLAAENGCVWVDPTRELPMPDPAWVATPGFNDPLLRDNIHQSYLGYKLYAWAIARAIAADHMVRDENKDYSVAVPSSWLRNGWTLGANVRLHISAGGRAMLQGNIGGGSTVVNVVVAVLPRWARPASALTLVTGNGVSFAVLGIATNGEISILQMGAGSSPIELSNINFQVNPTV